jgi:hypothetical protein
VAVLLQAARNLDGLVGPDPARHAQCDKRHVRLNYRLVAGRPVV